MAEATEFTIGARASCSDGPCGEVSRLVIDPAAGSVTHLVITPRHEREAGRLVPVELVSAMAGEISVRCTLAEFDRLDHAAERELVTGMEGVGGGLVGMEYGTQPGHPRMIIEDVTPVGEADVGPGERVHATDGEIGRVQGFIVDPDDHRVTHVLLQEGHFWGRKEVAIPISAVTGFDDGIRLNIGKNQVAELPPVSTSCP
jgi:sporulation protein YlmC with PRC-barrel domain